MHIFEEQLHGKGLGYDYGTSANIVSYTSKTPTWHQYYRTHSYSGASEIYFERH